MLKKGKTDPKWAVASVTLQDAYTDFILSRQAMICKPGTIRFYNFTAGRFVHWLEKNDVVNSEEISAKYIRAYLSELVSKGLSDSYINGHARAIRTLVKFFAAEGHIEAEPKFAMPSIAKKRLPLLTANQVKIVIQSCDQIRDKVLVMLMVDTGVRRKELCELNWEDIDIPSGVVIIRNGKAGKARSVIVGIKTRRLILKYRKQVEHTDKKPLLQTKHGKRFSFSGLRSCLLRIGKVAGIHLTPHMLRRTFATLCIRGGMNPLHLQALLGHSTLEMTRRYVTMIESDLASAHSKYGPIDNL